MLDVLKKKAVGYDVTEVTQEYVADEDGGKKLVKEKVTTKHVPPDLTALKTYMELTDGDLNAMTDEELNKKRQELLSELATIRPQLSDEQKSKETVSIDTNNNQ